MSLCSAHVCNFYKHSSYFWSSYFKGPTSTIHLLTNPFYLFIIYKVYKHFPLVAFGLLILQSETIVILSHINGNFDVIIQLMASSWIPIFWFGLKLKESVLCYVCLDAVAHMMVTDEPCILSWYTINSKQFTCTFLFLELLILVLVYATYDNYHAYIAPVWAPF